MKIYLCMSQIDWNTPPPHNAPCNSPESFRSMLLLMYPFRAHTHTPTHTNSCWHTDGPRSDHKCSVTSAPCGVARSQAASKARDASWLNNSLAKWKGFTVTSTPPPSHLNNLFLYILFGLSALHSISNYLSSILLLFFIEGLFCAFRNLHLYFTAVVHFPGLFVVKAKRRSNFI